VTARVRRQLPLAIAALAGVFVVKLSVLLTLGHHPLLVPAGELDGAYYFHFARQVAAGDWMLDDAASFFGRPAPAFFIPPLYIYVLALLLKIGGGSLEAARFGQIVLGTVAVGLLALTARRWYSTRAAWIAGALATFCGLFTFYEILILPAALEMFLTALDLYVLTWAVQTGAGWGLRPGDMPALKGRPAPVALAFLLTGAVLGLHALNRPAMLIVPVGLAVILVGMCIVQLAVRERRTAALTAGAATVALAAGAVLALAPATYRNWRVAGQLVPITSDAGLRFLAGNGPDADGTYRMPPGIRPTIAGQWIGASDLVQQSIGHPPSAREVSGFFFDKSFDWIRQHPREEVQLLAQKARYALSATFLTLNHSFPFFARDLRGPLTLLAVGPALVVPLGLVGLVLARPRDRSAYWLWASYIPLSMLPVVVFYVASRYRLPFQVALCVAGGGGTAWMIDRVRDREWRGFGLAVLATAALALLVAWPTGRDDGRAEEQVRMAMAEIQAGRTSPGEAWVQRAITRYGYPGVVHVRIGQLYEAQNQPEAALDHYRKAAAPDPAETSIQFVIGRALFAAGKDQEALDPLERARAGRERDAATRILVLAYTRMGRQADANRVVRELDPNRWSADVAREFAGAAAQLGRVDLSIPAWRRAAEASGNAQDYDRLGLAWAALGRAPEAIAAFSEAVGRDPKSAPIRLNFAVALAAGGRPDLGRRQAEEALKLDPGYARAKQFLAGLK
jgi:tetratricopeptide (TPR) repeat protein